MHREDVLGTDQVREVLLQIGDGPDLVPLIEPLTPESPVAKQIEKYGGRGGLAHVALRVAGAHNIQELAYAIAAGVERLAELTDSQPVDVAARQFEFVMAVGRENTHGLS